MYINFFIILVFLFLYVNKKISNEKLKGRISDSLLIGISEYYFDQVSNLKFYCVSKQIPDTEEGWGKFNLSLSDVVAHKVYYYLSLVDSLERCFTADEWTKYFEKSNRIFESIDTFGEAMRQLALIVALLSLYTTEKTKSKAMLLLETMPIKVMQEVKTVISYRQFNEAHKLICNDVKHMV